MMQDSQNDFDRGWGRHAEMDPNPVMRTDARGLLLGANSAAGPLLLQWGFAVGRHLDDHWAALIREAVETGCQRVFDIGVGSGTLSILVTPSPDMESVHIFGHDVSRLMSVQAELVDNQVRMATILNTMVDGLITSDEYGVIQSFNPAAEKIFGYTEREALGKNVSTLMPVYQRKEHEERLARRKSEGKPRVIGLRREVTALRGDGALVPVEIAVSEMVLGGKRHFAGVVRDISERKRADSEIRRRDTVLSVVAGATNRLMASGDLSKCVCEALQILGMGVETDRVYVFENHVSALTGEMLMSQRYEWAGDGVSAQIDNPALQSLAYSSFPGWYEELSAFGAVSGPVKRLPEPIRGHMESQGIQSILVVPVFVDEKFWGFIGFDDCRSEREWTEGEISILTASAASFGVAIVRHRAENELRESHNLLDALGRAQSRFIRETDPSTVFDDMLADCLRLTRSEYGFIGEIERDPDGTPFLRTIAISDISWDDATRKLYDDNKASGFEFRNLDTIFGAALRTLAPVISNDPANDPRRGGLPAGHPPLNAFLGVPFRTPGGVSVVIGLANRPGGYDESMVGYLHPFMAACGGLLEAYHAELGRRGAEKDMRTAMSRLSTFIGSLQAGVLLEDERRRIVLVNLAFCDLFGIPAAPQALVGADCSDAAVASAHLFLKPGHFVDRIGHILERREPVVGEEITTVDGRHLERDFVPVSVEGAYFGHLWMYRDVTERKRAAKELSEARDQEVAIGARIQETLLLGRPPAFFPGLYVASRTIPSQRVDGDFIDFFRHGDRHLDVLTGDVMGKGVPAALLGAAVKACFDRAFAHMVASGRNEGASSPREVMTFVHNSMTQHLMELDSFVTACFARFIPSTSKLVFVDCGHAKTIHLSAADGSWSLLEGDNTPMGFNESERYIEYERQYAPGDVFFFYSDGLTEARNEAGEFFGTERLARFVAQNATLDVDDLIDAAVEEVRLFSGVPAFADDVTCVAVRIPDIRDITPVGHAEIRLEGGMGDLSAIRSFVSDFIAPYGLSDERAASLRLAANEAAANVVGHAHGGEPLPMLVEADAFPRHVRVQIHYRGERFDPAYSPPPLFDGSMDRGFGLYIISNAVDDVSYLSDSDGRCVVRLMVKL